MADVIISPNMNLPVPEVGIEPGPSWASDINASLGILDQHNHSNGQGVQITPAGININTDLPINGNNLTLVNTVRFNNLLATLAGTAPNLGVIYEAVNDLYYNDGVGNVIQLTKAGSVNATSSGISSGTATASFVGGVLVVDANVNTPANVQGASFLFGNNVSGSNYLTLSPPNAMGSSYGVTLPPQNTSGSTAFLTYDTSDNMGIGPALNGGLTQANMGAVGQQISSSSGMVDYNSGGFTPINNLSVTITTTGRPVMIAIQPDGTNGNPNNINFHFINAGSDIGNIGLFRNITQVSSNVYRSISNISNNGNIYFPLPGFLFLDTPSAGTYTYTWQASVSNISGSIGVYYAVLVAYEL